MDDLEFRRRLLADPNDASPEMSESRNASLANRKLADELQMLDSKLEQAMKVDVPDDLVDRILFNQSGQPEKNRFGTKGWVALAASVAFVVGISIGQFRLELSPVSEHPVGIAQIALDHVQAEAPFIDGIDEGVTLSQVNAKLIPFGPKLNQLPGHVYYVNHCGFGAHNALHMVMESSAGKVTIFVVPETTQGINQFSGDNMQGVLMPVRDASLIIVGEPGQNLTPIAKELKADLNWEI